MRRTVFAILLCAVCHAASADPQISINPSFGSFVNGTPIINEISPNRFNIKIDFEASTAGAFPMTITSNSTNDIIAEIEFTASGPGTVIELVIDGNTMSGAISGLEVIEYIDPPAPRVPAGMSLNVLLHPTLGTGRIGRDPTGTIIEVESSISRIVCREITANIVANGSVSNVEVAGDVIGNITANGIFDLNIGGDLGPQRGGAKLQMNVASNVGTIEATNVYADIDVGGNIRDLLVYGSSSRGTLEATDAVFEGSLDCDTMNDGLGLRIWGDLDANVNIADEMMGITARMFIGRELAGNVSFGAGGMGVRGITIGWMPSATGIWSGVISVGSTTLSPKGDYTQTELGGGAVGLVPYGLHKQDCDPKYEGSMWPTVAYEGDCDAPVILPQGETIDLVHYGAIENLIVAPEKPFEVTWAGGNHCSGPSCVHGANYATDDWELDATDPFPDPRTMRLTGLLYPNRHYHVIVDETLKCLNVFGSSTTIETKPYVYVIYMSACP